MKLMSLKKDRNIEWANKNIVEARIHIGVLKTDRFFKCIECDTENKVTNLPEINVCDLCKQKFMVYAKKINE